MPPPSSENDLKRRARRRLIGAVGLTLAAVVLLPLLLEDEPPPARQLDVKMPAPTAVSEAPAGPVAVQPAPAAEPPPPAETPPEPKNPRPESKPEPEPRAAAKPPPQVAPKPEPKPESKPVPATQAGSDAYVVQLAALSDPAKVETLKARAALSGLPVFTDSRNGLTRVRVGPFASRQAAEAAQAKLRDQGLAGQVLAK